MNFFEEVILYGLLVTLTLAVFAIFSAVLWFAIFRLLGLT